MLAADTRVTGTTTSHEPCYRLIYRSRSRIPGDASAGNAGLADILRTARINNPAHGITGALMLYDDWFAQVLEGTQPSVERLFESIRADPRHDSVDVREARAVPGRVFGRWAMALVAEHGQPDIPLVAKGSGEVAEAAPWRPTEAQDEVLGILRTITRGYGRGS